MTKSARERFDERFEDTYGVHIPSDEIWQWHKEEVERILDEFVEWLFEVGTYMLDEPKEVMLKNVEQFKKERE